MRIFLFTILLLSQSLVWGQINSNIYAHQYLSPQYVRQGMTFSGIDVTGLLAKGILAHKLNFRALNTLTDLRVNAPTHTGVGSSISMQPFSYPRLFKLEGGYPGNTTFQGSYSFAHGIRSEVLAGANFTGQDVNQDGLADLPLSGQAIASVSWSPYRYDNRGFVHYIGLEYLTDHGERRLASDGSTLYKDGQDHLLLMARMRSEDNRWNLSAGGSFGNRSIAQSLGEVRFTEGSVFGNLKYHIARSYGNWRIALDPTFNMLRSEQDNSDGVEKNNANYLRVAAQTGLDYIPSKRLHLYADLGVVASSWKVRPIARLGFNIKEQYSYDERWWFKLESNLVQKPFNVFGEYGNMLHSSRSIGSGQSYMEEWKWSNDMVAMFRAFNRIYINAWARYDHYFDFVLADFSDLSMLNAELLHGVGIASGTLEAKQMGEAFSWSVNYRFQKVTSGHSIPYLPEHAVTGTVGGDVLAENYVHDLKPVLECGVLSPMSYFYGGQMVEASDWQPLVNFQVEYFYGKKFMLALGARNILGQVQSDSFWTAGDPSTGEFDASNQWGLIQGRSFFLSLGYYFR